MDHIALKEARKALGLSIRDMAKILETDPQSVRRIEMPPERSTARTPAPRVVRLIQAMLDGWRPSDFPKENTNA